MARCERFPGVTAKFPFGAWPKCYCVGGRICTVLVEQMPEDVLLDMLSHAYKTIFNKLPKRTRLAIEQGESEENAI